MRAGSLGNSSRDIFRRSTFQSTSMTRKCRSSLNSGLGSMTMTEYEKKFLGLLKYVGFIKDEKVMLEILHTHLGFIFPKVFPMFISHYSVSYILGRIFL
jgi:hypothetical protein